MTGLMCVKIRNKEAQKGVTIQNDLNHSFEPSITQENRMQQHSLNYHRL